MTEESIKIEAYVEIEAPPAHVYAVFAGLDHWRAALPDVLDVKVLYDDGNHQEFLMTVERPNGAETIRGIRYLDGSHEIELFQPVPPPGFKKMCGVWRFTQHGGHTEVQATRQFQLTEDNPISAAEAVKKLREFLQTNLRLFKDYVEYGMH